MDIWHQCLCLRCATWQLNKCIGLVKKLVWVSIQCYGKARECFDQPNIYYKMIIAIGLVNIYHLSQLQLFFLWWEILRSIIFANFKYKYSIMNYKPMHIWWTNIWQCESQQNGKFLKRWEYHATLPASWEICMQVKKRQLELDMERWPGSKFGKDYKAIYCHPAYLTYMQSTSREILG